MVTTQVPKEHVTTDAVRAAIRNLAEYRLPERIHQIDGDEAHRMLPTIWPMIQNLCLIANACESGMIEVKG
jgi:hypothetical protein